MASASSADLERIIGAIRAAGARITTPKRAVIAALLSNDRHRTAEQLAVHVQRSHPDVHTSTIYRNLHSLEELGVVEHVHLGHGPAVYHLTDRAHHHLVCDSCGQVQEVPDSALAGIVRKLETEFHFAASPRHFAIAGRCKACR